MKFILFHGSFGGPDHNWFPDLKRKLEKIGHVVLAPQFPVDNWNDVTNHGINSASNRQNLSSWISAFDNFISEMDKKDSICFVGHSVGALFILHVVLHYKIDLDSAIFVCPFFRKLQKSWQIDFVNKTFYKSDFDFNTLKNRIPLSYAVYSDDGPYVDRKYSLEFAQKLNSKEIEIVHGQHLNTEFGVTSFPLIYDLCVSRLDASKYKDLYTVK